MVTAVFKNGETTATTKGLTKHDYGQILRIKGLSLPQYVAVQFAADGMSSALPPVIGETIDGITDVLIPNSLLRSNIQPWDYTITAYVYIVSGTSGKTEYIITIPVKWAPRLGDESVDDDNLAAITKAVEQMNEAADRAEAAAKSAESAKIIVDSELNETSTNPIQNAVIAMEIGQLEEQIKTIDLGYAQDGLVHIFLNGNPIGEGILISSGDYIAVTGLSVTPSDVTFKTENAMLTLVAVVEPDDATRKNVKWETSDPSIVTVSSDGVITSIANGSAIITATCDGCSTSISVNVKIPVPVTGISFSSTEVSADEGDIISAPLYTITPENASNRTVIWSSSDENVATITSNGKVTCVKEGISIITVTTEDGGYTASYTLTVGQPATYVKDDLIFDIDGINNTGTGVQDTTATIWKDLSGNGYDIDLTTMYNLDATVNKRWVNGDGYSTGTGAGYPSIEAFSIEEVDCSESGFTVNFVGFIHYSNGAGSAIAVYDIDTLEQYYQWSNGTQIPFGNGSPADIRVNSVGKVTLPEGYECKDKKCMITVVEKTGNVYEVYYNGELVKSGTGSGTHTMALKHIQLLDRFTGMICHASVYGRALTADEIAETFSVFDKIYGISGIASVSGNYPASMTVLPYTELPLANVCIVPSEKTKDTVVSYTVSTDNAEVIDNE